MRSLHRTFLILSALAVLLAACAAPVERGGTDAVMDALVVAVPSGSSEQAALAAAEAYTLSSGAPVRVAVIPANQYERKVPAALMAGLDDYDLVYLPAESLPRWASYRALRPWQIAPEDIPAQMEKWLPLLTVEGAVYGLPAEADPLLLWFREDLRAGLASPAESWPDFRAYALAASVPPERYGFVPAVSQREAALDLAVFMTGFGAPDALALNSPEAREGFAFYASMRSEDGAAPPVPAVSGADAERLAGEEGRNKVIEALLDGSAAMGFAPRTAGSQLFDCTVKGNAACDVDRPLLSAANPPGKCVLLDALWAWAAPLHSTRPEAAERFAAWLVSEEGTRAWNAGGGYPVVMESGACFQTAFPPAADPDALYALVGTLAAPDAAALTSAELSARFEAAESAAQAEIRRQGISMPAAD